MARSIWNGTITFGAHRRAGQALHGDRVEDGPLPRGPPRRRREDRAPAVLLQGGRGGPVRARSSRATRSPRASSSSSRRTRSRPPPATAAHVIDIEHFVDAGADRPGLLRQDLLPRRGRRRRRRLPAAARRARADRPRRPRPLHLPRPRVPRRGPPARRRARRCTRCASPTSSCPATTSSRRSSAAGPAEKEVKMAAQARRLAPRRTSTRADYEDEYREAVLDGDRAQGRRAGRPCGRGEAAGATTPPT